MYTIPTGDNGILASTTQQRLFDRAAEQAGGRAITDARVDDLHAADGVFLAGTVRGRSTWWPSTAPRPSRDVDLVRTVQKLAGF